MNCAHETGPSKSRAWPGGAMRVPGAHASIFSQMTNTRSCLFSPLRSLPAKRCRGAVDQQQLQASRRGVRRRLFTCGHANASRGQRALRAGRGRLLCVAVVTQQWSCVEVR